MAKIAEEKSFANSENIGKYIEVNGFNIHYYEEGEGQPLLFVHGRNQSMYTWRNNIKEFAKYYRVYLVDMIGFGYSDKPELEYSIRDNCEFIRFFLDALGIRTAHIAGFSEGAVHVLDFAMQYPERVDRMILVSPGGITRHYPLLERLMRFQWIGELCTPLLTKKAIQKRLLDAFFDETNVNEEMVNQNFKPISNKEARNAILTSIRSWNDSDILEGIKSIFHPVFIAWGENDKWHPIAASKVYEEALPNSQLYILRNCGHLAHEEKFREFNSAALEFLTGEKVEKAHVV